MQQSETIEKIAPALLEAQREIGAAVKNSKNPHFKSEYADISAVIDAIKPALNKNGIVFMQHPAPSENGEARLTTRLMHSSGQWIESTITVPTSKADAQGYGSALTYARRYALSAIVGLPQEDDDGNEASRQAKAPNKQNGKPTSVAGICFQNLNEEMQKEVIAMANYIEEVAKEGKIQEASDVLRNFVESFPDDESVKPAVWSRLQSKTRSAINALIKGAQQ